MAVASDFRLDPVGIDMKEEIAELFQQLKQKPFPKLGYEIGDFPLYDSLLAGVASCVAKNQPVKTRVVPRPDPATLEAINALRKKSDLGEQEKIFLDYYELLEAITHALEKELD